MLGPLGPQMNRNSIDSTIRKVKTCNTFKHKIKETYSKEIKQKEDDLYNN